MGLADKVGVYAGARLTSTSTCCHGRYQYERSVRVLKNSTLTWREAPG